MPYVFQLFAALLESNPSGALPDHYKALVGPLLAPALWETRGNVPALTRLLAAILPRSAGDIVANNHLEAVLGIFQMLLSGKKTEQNAFELLESIVTSVERYCPIYSQIRMSMADNVLSNALDNYVGTILRLVLTKLQNNASDPLKFRFVRFYHLVSSKVEAGLGADYFISKMDIIQENVFTPIYLTIILPVSEQFVRPVDRKVAVISFTKSLADSQAFAQRYGNKGWRLTCEAMLKLLANPPKVADGAGDEVITEADVDDIGFGMGFTPLNTCKKPPHDDFPEIQDVPQWVRVYLTQANVRHNNAIAKYVQERLTPEGQSALAMYMK